MRTVTWVRMFVAAVLVGTVVVSCSRDEGSVRSEAPAVTVLGPGEETSAPFEEALEHAPLDQLPGSSFAGDDHALWYTDFVDLARYAIEEGVWTTYTLPQQADVVHFVADGDGGITMFTTDCHGECGEVDEPPTYAAWHVSIDGRARAIPLPDQPDVPPSRAGLSSIVPTTGIDRPAQFLIHAVEDSHLVVVDDTTARITPFGRAMTSLCPIDDIYLAIATTAVESDRESLSWTGDETWEELRRQIEEFIDSTVLAGPAPDDLAPLPVPDEVAALLDSGAFVDACLGDRLVVIGGDEAYELDPRSGRWSDAPSQVRDDPAEPAILGRQYVTGFAVGPAPEQVWLAGTSLTIHRDADGWHRGPRGSGFVVTHGHLFTYPGGDK
ncbi:MAG: hypothetical protein GXY13_07225 [Acidimicrobiales bacterium]|nr:hypothetical protein [Acidimicrobiales bacterium]